MRLLRSPLVVAATVVALIAAAGAARNRGAVLPTFLLAWLLTFIAGKVGKWLWWRCTYPAAPPWSKPPARRPGARMLREDLNARLFSDHFGFLLGRRHWFVGTGCPPVPVSRDAFRAIEAGQSQQAMEVAATDERTWWHYQDRFYWENRGYSAQDVTALLRDRERREERRLQRAHDLLALDQAPGPRRSPIPRDVRRAVFERDGGRCVDCGGTFDLQYDHILPVALGGATTAENLQLLCSACNRDKSDSP